MPKIESWKPGQETGKPGQYPQIPIPASPALPAAIALPEPFRQVQLFQFLLNRAGVLLSAGSDANALDADGHSPLIQTGPLAICENEADGKL